MDCQYYIICNILYNYIYNMPGRISPFLNLRGVLNIIGLMSPVIITFLVFF